MKLRAVDGGRPAGAAHGDGDDVSSYAIRQYDHWAQTWRGKGPTGWRGGRWQDEELWDGREAALLSVIEGCIWESTTFRASLPYLASKSRQSTRSVSRKLKVFQKAGILSWDPTRVDGNAGRFEVSVFTYHPERRAFWEAHWEKTHQRPVEWDGQTRRNRSDMDTVSIGVGAHEDRLRSAAKAAGMREDDDIVIRWLAVAVQADKGARRLEVSRGTVKRRTEALTKREEAQQKLEAEIAAVLADLEKLPRAAATSPPSSPAPAPALLPTTVLPPEFGGRPDPEGLLAALQRFAAEGKGYAVTALPRVLKRGYRLTDGEKQVLRQMLDEEAQREGGGARNVTTAPKKKGRYHPDH